MEAIVNSLAWMDAFINITNVFFALFLIKNYKLKSICYSIEL